MADLFLSYSRADQATVEKLAAALEARGLALWWDRHMESGAQFSKEIEQQIEQAKAALVCWSKDSVESRWVRDEANYAAERDKLLAVTLDGTLPPMGFGQYHAVSLQGWNGNEADLEPLFGAIQHNLGEEVAELPRAPVARTKPRNRLLMPALLVLLLAAAGIAYWQFGAGDDAVAGEEQMQASIAVLPFEALSEDESDQFFGRGIAEELLNALSNYPDLKVAGRASAFSFEDSGALNNEIGEQLGVENILQGTVRRSGDRVRITASLSSASDGSQLWSETYERELTDIFAIQDEIVAELARVLQFRLGVGAGAGRADGKDVDPRAYEAYLRGLYFWHRRIDPQSRFEAISAFQQATELDPDFADGWSALGMSVAWSSSYVERNFGIDAVEVTENALSRARSLDPGNARANAVSAAWDEDADAARDAFALAYERAPNDSLVNYAGGMMYEYLGNFDEAIRHFDRALRLDPLNRTIWRVRALSLAGVGRFEEVEDDLRALATCDDQCTYANVILAANGLVARLHDSDPDRISPWLDLLVENHRQIPSPTEYDAYWLGWLEGRAREIVEGTPFEAEPFTDAENFSLGVGMATPAALLAHGGQIDSALDLLEVGYEKRELFGPNDFWPLLDGAYEFPEEMRRHPRFHAIWAKPDMARLAEIRRENGRSAGLPLPIE